MKLNNKGFAITAVLYGLLILFVILVSSYLLVLSAKKERVDLLTSEIEENYRNDDDNLTTMKIGDYVSYTPIVASYPTDTTKTGYSKSQTIYPNELTLWRVFNKNADGSVEIISEYVSSTAIYFGGRLGYLNYVGYLNVLAEQYETPGITSGSRYFGYNGQTEYITEYSKFTVPAPWTNSTIDNSNESVGGGDILYEKDYNQLQTALGTTIAYSIPSLAGSSPKSYWMASRMYNYDSSNSYNWSARYVSVDGIDTYEVLHNWASTNFSNSSRYQYLRPIVTLMPELQYTGQGTIDSPWQIK